MYVDRVVLGGDSMGLDQYSSERALAGVREFDCCSGSHSHSYGRPAGLGKSYSI